MVVVKTVSSQSLSSSPRDLVLGVGIDVFACVAVANSKGGFDAHH